jgi:hypothetical protein
MLAGVIDDIDGQGGTGIHHANPARLPLPASEHRQPAIYAHASRIIVAVNQASRAVPGAGKPGLNAPPLQQHCRQFGFRRGPCDAGYPNLFKLPRTIKQ